MRVLDFTAWYAREQLQNKSIANSKDPWVSRTLAEGFVALIGLVTVIIVAQDAARGKAPGTIYGNGGQFLTLIIGRDKLAFAVTFGAIAFSTFVFDTLEVDGLVRYIVQELFGWKGRIGRCSAPS